MEKSHKNFKLKKNAYRDIVIPNFGTMEEYQIFLNDLIVKKNYEVEKGNFVEADELKHKIEECKDFFTNEKRELFKKKQIGEIDSVNNNYTSEVNEFDNKWKKLFFDFETKSSLAVEKLVKKNADEIKQLEETVDKEAKNIKFTSYYKKLIEMQDKLVEKEKYLEAQIIRDRILKVKESEIDKYLKEELIKYNSQVSKLNKHHDIELNSLKKRIEKERLNLQRDKLKESQDLEFKYKSNKIKIEVKQRLEKKNFIEEIKHEKDQKEKKDMK